MSKTKPSSDNLEKEDVLRAVLIADDFDDAFSSFLVDGCSAFLPLASRKIVDYALEWLSKSGIQETILFCSIKADAIREYIRNSQWNRDGSPMNVFVFVSEGCASVGDALRDLDNKSILKSDFILLSTSSVANFCLQDILKEHKAQCKKDKGTVMTMILQDRGCVAKGKETVVAMDSSTNCLLLYSKSGSTQIELLTECMQEHPQLTLYSTLQDTGIAICTPSVPMLFSDNFDFLSKEDFIRGLLVNEEVLASRIYGHVTSAYGQTVTDWPSYQRISMDIIHRWTYPLVPDVKFGVDDTLIQHRSCVYKHSGVNLSKGCKLDADVVIGKNCNFGSDVRLFRCVIGSNCTIGDNVVLQDSFIMDNVTILTDTKIELCVVGESVKIAANCCLKNCQLQNSTILPEKSTLADKIIISEQEDRTCEKLGISAFVKSVGGGEDDSDGGAADENVTWLVDPYAESDLEDDVSSVTVSEESRSVSPEADDCTMFYSEVVDSLQRGYEENLPCSNLILEVNSSRYAYNVTLSEVTQLTCKAVLALPSRLHCPAKPMLVYFKPLFSNYIKTADGQTECLSAFEEMHDGLGNEINTCLHYLYDEDILTEEVILKWHSGLDEDHSLKSKLNRFVVWLQEAAEESDEE